MAATHYDVPDPKENPDAYLSYSVQDAPNVSYEAWLHSRGKSYTWLRRNRLGNDNGYEEWRKRTLQNYDNYLQSYNKNFEAELARRSRLEAAGFSGQYLANGIGGGSSSASGASLGSGMSEPAPFTSKGEKGLNKVLQSLQLMSAAGVAMKNFGEGKAAMQYADDMAGARLTTEQNKGRGFFFDAGLKELRYNSEFMLQNDPSEYGYKRNESGRWVFDPNNSQGITGRNMRLEAFLQNMESTEAQILLRKQQQQLNQLTYENRQLYEAETMKAQKELLEGKKALQDIEKEYAERLRQMGIAAPIIKMGLETFKLFL